ncbi:MAG: sugar phosphate isomerase/epimerase [Chloroflexi bacterium]|nr:sugar phosphate isomerase/epimerase [Chloroflexota bacterium]
MPNFAAELFTVRDWLGDQHQLHEAVHRLAGVGFEWVELAAVAAVDGPDADTSPATLRRILDDHGLRALSAHRRFGELRDNTEAELEYLQTLGCKMVAPPVIFDVYDYRDFDGYRRFLDDAAPVQEKLSAAGIDFAYHNHSHEFVYFAGTNPMEYLIENSDMQMELDTYWTAISGADPAAMIRRLERRIRYLHCKDAQVFPTDDPDWFAKPEPTWAPVGEGLLNWDAILPAAAAAGTEYYIIEQDICRRDPFDCLASSLQFLKDRVAA